MVAPLLLVAGDGFSGWQPLNDTIMGGNSQGRCRGSSEGLVMEAYVEPEGGGFVSCRSPAYAPPLELSRYGALELAIDGDGRRYKLALACRDGVAGLTELIPGGLRWVAEFSTQSSGTSVVTIPFNRLTPSVRATPVGLPLRFDPAGVTRIQVLHSKFGDVGGRNPGFRPGELRLLIRSIRAVP
ncbi:MAG: CIA30 family protein [Synechococcaceae bacterium WB8_1B_136]|nr:CIA30 family protein [Synechococcaceae bacterium WB8_1B_136]